MSLSGRGSPSASASMVKLPVLLPMTSSGSAAWMRANRSSFCSRISWTASMT